jgi:hypothetical protein
MNWTEGSLARYSKGRPRTGDEAKQKEHFAKARMQTKTRRSPVSISFLPFPSLSGTNNSRCGPPAITALDSKHRSRSRSSTRSSRHRLLKHTGLHKETGHTTGHFPASQTPGGQSSKRTAPKGLVSSSGDDEIALLEAKRMKLLLKPDWTGVTFQKPMDLQDGRKLQQIGAKRSFFEPRSSVANVPVRHSGSQSNEIHVRIGSRDIFHVARSSPGNIKVQGSSPVSRFENPPDVASISSAFVTYQSPLREVYRHRSPRRHRIESNSINGLSERYRSFCKTPTNFRHTKLNRTQQRHVPTSTAKPYLEQYSEGQPEFHEPKPRRAHLSSLLQCRSWDYEVSDSVAVQVERSPPPMPASVAQYDREWMNFVAPSLAPTGSAHDLGVSSAVRRAGSNWAKIPVSVNVGNSSEGLMYEITSAEERQRKTTPRLQHLPRPKEQIRSDKENRELAGSEIIAIPSDSDSSFPDSLDFLEREELSDRGEMRDRALEADGGEMDALGSSKERLEGVSRQASDSLESSSPLELPPLACVRENTIIGEPVKKLSTSEETQRPNKEGLCASDMMKLPPPMTAKSLGECQGQAAVEDADAIWQRFVFGDEIDEMDESAFEIATKKAARALVPSGSVGSLENEPAISSLGFEFDSSTATDAAKYGGRNELAVPVHSREPFHCWRVTQSEETPSLEIPAKISAPDPSNHLNLLGSLPSSPPFDSIIAECGTSSEAQSRPEAKFSRPKLFEGRLVGSAQLLDCPPILSCAKSREGGRGRRRERGRGRRRTDDGRADLRSLPDFDGDPIEE